MGSFSAVIHAFDLKESGRYRSPNVWSSSYLAPAEVERLNSAYNTRGGAWFCGSATPLHLHKRVARLSAIAEFLV